MLAAQSVQEIESLPRRTRRVLVAGTQETIETVQHALGEGFDVLAARSTEEALERLDAGADLVVCNVRFDESRMFNFLQALGETPALRNIPVLCCRTSPELLSPAVKHAIEMALEALGIATFVDCAPTYQAHGKAAAERWLRQAILAKLPA
jgi:hypothetical protein